MKCWRLSTLKGLRWLRSEKNLESKPVNLSMECECICNELRMEGKLHYLCILAVVKGQEESAELPLGSIKNYYDNGKIRFQFCNGKIYTDTHTKIHCFLFPHISRSLLLSVQSFWLGKASRDALQSPMPSGEQPFLVYSFLVPLLSGYNISKKSGQALDDRKELSFFPVSLCQHLAFCSQVPHPHPHPNSFSHETTRSVY